VVVATKDKGQTQDKGNIKKKETKSLQTKRNRVVEKKEN
jgi:hypothetical protein